MSRRIICLSLFLFVPFRGKSFIWSNLRFDLVVINDSGFITTCLSSGNIRYRGVGNLITCLFFYKIVQPYVSKLINKTNWNLQQFWKNSVMFYVKMFLWDVCAVLGHVFIWILLNDSIYRICARCFFAGFNYKLTYVNKFTAISFNETCFNKLRRDSNYSKKVIRLMADVFLTYGNVLWDLGAGNGCICLGWVRNNRQVVCYELKSNKVKTIIYNVYKKSLMLPIKIRLGKALNTSIGVVLPNSVFFGYGIKHVVLWFHVCVHAKLGCKFVVPVVTSLSKLIFNTLIDYYDGKCYIVTVSKLVTALNGRFYKTYSTVNIFVFSKLLLSF